MERLTIRNSDGSVSQPTGLNWAAALERLAAYEDTGLEPCETSEKYATIMAFNRLRLKISLARLCEILQAETEGRCVVLPCMIGDTLNKCVNQAREFEELYTKALCCNRLYSGETFGNVRCWVCVAKTRLLKTVGRDGEFSGDNNAERIAEAALSVVGESEEQR